uniref:ATP synthase complex subunit 8 n=1 Tax=Atelura formicaria TaxID=459531 RepID=B5KMD6_9INSE|nr:ATP synthase F0 subunit 8 [Atelura formicaria]ABS88979.1 ATP synthase F0 subunit 8 [Atelura formicaria]
MPQMAPISWLILFILFSITFIVFSSVNFFIFSPPSSKKTTLSFDKKMSTWKW